ncbi:MAG: potassium-transporting ATPase subunit C [Ferrimicrobium sp.]
MFRQLWRSVVSLLIFFVLLGVLYPLAMTGVAQVISPHTANGSLSAQGSTMYGQRWSGPRWFHGRPDPDQGLSSGIDTGGTNLGPNSKVLEKLVAKRIAYWHRLGVNPTAELVVGSGSGVDPDISPASAYVQVGMVASARHLPIKTVQALVSSQIHGRQFGFLGAPYINVLQLNEALQRLVP